MDQELLGSTSKYPCTKVGKHIDIHCSSTGPPANWVETYRVTEIKDGKVYGVYIGMPQLNEYSLKELE